MHNSDTIKRLLDRIRREPTCACTIQFIAVRSPLIIMPETIWIISTFWDTHTRAELEKERRQCRVVHLLQKRVPTAFDLFRSVENLITAKMVFWFMYFSARLEGLSWLIGWANTNEWVQRRTDSAHLRVNQYYKHRWHHFNEIYCTKKIRPFISNGGEIKLQICIYIQNLTPAGQLCFFCSMYRLS